jgi:hypothetical protein
MPVTRWRRPSSRGPSSGRESGGSAAWRIGAPTRFRRLVLDPGRSRAGASDHSPGKQRRRRSPARDPGSGLLTVWIRAPILFAAAAQGPGDRAERLRWLKRTHRLGGVRQADDLRRASPGAGRAVECTCSLTRRFLRVMIRRGMFVVPTDPEVRRKELCAARSTISLPGCLPGLGPRERNHSSTLGEKG